MDITTESPSKFLYTALLCITTLVAVYLTKWLYTYVKTRRSVKGLPQIHSALEIFETALRSSSFHVPLFWPTRAYTIDDPWKKYADSKSDLIALTQLSTPNYAVYITSNPEASQLILRESKVFLKSMELLRYRSLNIFGRQIVSAQNGLDHRHHKTAVRGCFGEPTMREGWDSMESAFKKMVHNETLNNGGVLINVKEVLSKVTMQVICRSWFGLDIPWRVPHTQGSGMSFYEALHVVENSLMAHLMLPLWFMEYNPFGSMRRFGKAQRSMLQHIKMMMNDRRSQLAESKEKTSGSADILGALVAAQMDEEMGFIEEEVIGNIFIFVIAGHETTAHALSFALALLALHPEWQEEIHKEIIENVGNSYPSYKDVNALPLALAACYESIRLRDLVMSLPKVANEDTEIPYTTWDATGTQVANRTRIIPKGSHIIVDTPASQCNPFYWEDPMKFDPRRHIGASGFQAKPGFVGFALGERKCIGKRFAEVEMVCFLSHMVKSFTWTAVSEEGESHEELGKRILRGTEVVNLNPGIFDLKLEKRL